MAKDINPYELLKLKQEKQYAVKAFISEESKSEDMFKSVEDVDMSKRLVKYSWNTPLFLDSDYDFILPNAGNKSIKERGPESKATAKIKPLKNHDFNCVTGKIQYLGEEEITWKGRKIITSTCINKINKTSLGNDQLIEYQEDNIDNHSFGFQYVEGKIKLIERKNKDEWNKYVDMALNPKKFDETDYFFVISEYNMFENSSVAFGANSLTPYLGVKSGNKDALKLKLIDRLTALQGFIKGGLPTDEGEYTIDLQIMQIKQMITELSPYFDLHNIVKPIVEDTPIIEAKGIDYSFLRENLRK